MLHGRASQTRGKARAGGLKQEMSSKYSKRVKEGNHVTLDEMKKQARPRAGGALAKVSS